QRQVLRLLGVDGYATAQVSTDLALDRKGQVLNLIALGLIDPVEVARDAFSNAKDVLADSQTRFDAALNQELPLIGKSVNQLLLDAGFDLFSEFENAVAPAADALSQVGTLDQRFGQLEQLLESALGVSDDVIKIVYDDANAILDIVFNFHPGYHGPFAL